MNTFDWLLVMHLVGDWVLQNDWMTVGKRRGLFTLAGSVHFALYTATVVGALWLCGLEAVGTGFFLVRGGLVFVSHWLIDATSLAERWRRFYRQSDLDWVCVVVDQTLHVLVLAFLALLSVGKK